MNIEEHNKQHARPAVTEEPLTPEDFAVMAEGKLPKWASEWAQVLPRYRATVADLQAKLATARADALEEAALLAEDAGYDSGPGLIGAMEIRELKAAKP